MQNEIVTPNGRRRREFFENITSPRGVSARRRRKFLGDFWDVVHKKHVAGTHSGTCFQRKTPPKSSKISACGGPPSPKIPKFPAQHRVPPPPLFQNGEKQGGTRGGGLHDMS